MAQQSIQNQRMLTVWDKENRLKEPKEFKDPESNERHVRLNELLNPNAKFQRLMQKHIPADDKFSIPDVPFEFDPIPVVINKKKKNNNNNKKRKTVQFFKPTFKTYSFDEDEDEDPEDVLFRKFLNNPSKFKKLKVN